MIGIRAVAGVLADGRASNRDREEEFELEPTFLGDKLGVVERAVASEDEDAFSLGLKAARRLVERQALDAAGIDAIIFVTQTPGQAIPHLSARLHGALDAPQACACFDLSLGCSGYVYALGVAKAFMEANGLKCGLIVTSDPYSKIINAADKNTALLFGDGATATLLTDDPVFRIGTSTFSTRGVDHQHLQTSESGNLEMNGRAVFTFCAQVVPGDIRDVVEKNGLSLEEIDRFVLHQGSKFIVDTIRMRLRQPESKVPFLAANYGNTVSSSIPLILEQEIENSEVDCLVLSGFGLGLSWASTVLTRVATATTTDHE